MSKIDPATQSGILYGVAAYSIWSIAPLYFKELGHVPAQDILSHRIVWSFIVAVFLMLVLRKGQDLLNAMNTKTLLAITASSLLIALNWGTYIYAVNSEQILSASLGYYINPLVSIVLGMIFFKDRLDRTKKWAAWLCLAAVIFEIVQFGSLPWIALSLALSFGFYGLIRKKIAVDSFTGMILETAILLPYALIQLYWFGSDVGFLQEGAMNTTLLLMAAGPITMVPLMFFSAAANRISLVTLGFFQYIGPSALFVLAVFLYGEPFNEAKLVTFGLIWSALALLIFSSVRQMRKPKTVSVKSVAAASA